MTRPAPLKSQRLLRKGALVEQAYSLLREWHEDQSVEENFRRVLHGTFRTTGWEDEVQTTLRVRLSDPKVRHALGGLAKAGMPIEDWRYCLLTVIVTQEHDYRDFALNWLYPEFVDGRHAIRVEDLALFVRRSWADSRPGVAMSDYGAKRHARDLLRMARDLGVLSGDGPVKQFRPAPLSDQVFLFACHWIRDAEQSSAKVPGSDLWRGLLLRPEDVHTELLRLHQFKKVEYWTAGSLVHLELTGMDAPESADRVLQ